MMFKLLLLYELLTMNTIELTFVSKTIVDVINESKVVTLSWKNEVIDVDTFNVDLRMMNVWCSDFPTEVIDDVITSGSSDVWCRVSMINCCCETAEKVPAEFSPLASCLMIEGTVMAEFGLRADEVEYLKVLSPGSCVMTEGMLMAEFELRAGAVNSCEISLFNDWVMPWTMNVAGMRSEADKTDGFELIEDIKGIINVSILCLTCLWACSLSLISLIVSRWAVVMNLKWINDRPCSIAPIIAHWRQWWCL